jgi:hypothetical protein
MASSRNIYSTEVLLIIETLSRSNKQAMYPAKYIYSPENLINVSGNGNVFHSQHGMIIVKVESAT